jgi:phosphoserine phosphatase
MLRLVAWGEEGAGWEAELLRAFGDSELLALEQTSSQGRAFLTAVWRQGEGDAEVVRVAAALGIAHVLEEISAPVEAGPGWEVVAIGRPLVGPAIGALLERLGEVGARPTRLERRVAKGGLDLLRLRVAGPDERIAGLRTALLEQAALHGLDLGLQRLDVHRRHKRLVVMDMDSTLVTIEVIDELARACGKYQQVAEITERAMRGEFDFEQSLRARVALLAGQSAEVLDRIAENLPLADGAEVFVAALRRLGIRTAVLSGGFLPAVEAARKRLGLDYAFANRLEVRDGKFTGGLEGPIVDARRKAELLAWIAEREGVDLAQVVAVGDGANDRLMLERAGLGVAYRAKPALRLVADASFGLGGLDSILYLFGLDDEDIAELVSA